MGSTIPLKRVVPLPGAVSPVLSQKPGLSLGFSSGMPKTTSNGTEQGAARPGPYFFALFSKPAA